MEVSLTSAPASTSSPSTATNAAEPNAIGRNAFLNLLIAQLEHQNPLSPMENTEFTAQLAQFSVLEQMEAMNSSLGALLSSQEALGGMQATGFIGKEIRAAGNAIGVRQGETPSVSYTLDADSTHVNIRIANDAGHIVRTITEVNQSAGEHTIPWNGRGDLGNALPDGTYHITVGATDGAGEAVDADTMMQGIVEGIEFEQNRPLLLVGGSRLEFSSVLSVRDVGAEE